MKSPHRDYEASSIFKRCGRVCGASCYTGTDRIRPPAREDVFIIMKMPNSLEAHKQLIYRCVQTLEHSCKCSEAKCRLGTYSCQRMKLVFYHTRVCRRKLTDNCGICRQLVVLCCHHARGCRARHCVVPYCCQIKKRGDLRNFRDPVIFNHIN